MCKFSVLISRGIAVEVMGQYSSTLLIDNMVITCYILHKAGVWVQLLCCTSKFVSQIHLVLWHLPVFDNSPTYFNPSVLHSLLLFT